jgi:hypothetical protein
MALPADWPKRNDAMAILAAVVASCVPRFPHPRQKKREGAKPCGERYGWRELPGPLACVNC